MKFSIQSNKITNFIEKPLIKSNYLNNSPVIDSPNNLYQKTMLARKNKNDMKN